MLFLIHRRVRILQRSRAPRRRLRLELVQKVTGHRTTDIVLKHYFQPGREEFRRALQSAMPKLHTNGNKTPKDEMLEILDRISATTWQKDAKRLRELVAAL